ncbi:MAG: type II secretion system protein [Candidatus Omnitrophota bacterium]
MSKKGLTLIEMVTATLVIAILSAGMFSAFIASRYFTNRARHRAQAFNFAGQALDKMSGNYQWGQAEMASGNHAASGIGVSVAGEMSGLVPDPDSYFTYNVSDTAADGYKTVTVTVKWDEPR